MLKQLLPAIGVALIALALSSGQGQAGQRSGDANCDGVINAIDAALVLQFDAGLVDSLPCPGFADVNLNHIVNAVDAAVILQMDAGLLSGPLVPPNKYLALEYLRGDLMIGFANLSPDWTACDLVVWIEVLTANGWTSIIADHVFIGDLRPGESDVVNAPRPNGSWSDSRAVAEWRWCLK